MKMLYRYAALCACAVLLSCSRATGDAAGDDGQWSTRGADTVVYHGKQQPSFIRVGVVGNEPTQLATLPGRITWTDEVTARVFTPVNGRIEQIYVAPGAQVRRGQALVRLLSADFGQAQADASKGAADESAARRSYERAQELLTAGVLARKDFEQAEADWKRAQAESARARSHLDALGESRTTVDGGFVLRSPVDGVVVERAVNAGTEVRSDAVAPLFVITNPDQLTLQLELPESLSSQVEANQEFTFSVSTQPGLKGTARLTHVAAGVDPLTRTVHARAVVLGNHATLRGDAFIEAQLPLRRPAATSLQVPADAVILVGEQYFVFTTTDRSFRRVPVAVASLARDVAELSSGVRAGDGVVTDGALYLEQLLESGTGA